MICWQIMRRYDHLIPPSYFIPNPRQVINASPPLIVFRPRAHRRARSDSALTHCSGVLCPNSATGTGRHRDTLQSVMLGLRRTRSPLDILRHFKASYQALAYSHIGRLHRADAFVLSKMETVVAQCDSIDISDEAHRSCTVGAASPVRVQHSNALHDAASSRERSPHRGFIVFTQFR